MQRFRYQWVLPFFYLDLIVGKIMILYSAAFIIGSSSICFRFSHTLKFCIDLLHLITPTVCRFRCVIIIIIIMTCEQLGVVSVPQPRIWRLSLCLSFGLPLLLALRVLSYPNRTITYFYLCSFTDQFDSTCRRVS